MNVLVACERSQVVCAAFRAWGHNAYSNDILPCKGKHPEWHIIGDARRLIKGSGIFKTEFGNLVVIKGHWDLIIAHPPCTMLSHVSAPALAQGKHTMEDVKRGADFFMEMLNAPCERVAVENPAPMKCAGLPDYSQIIQPYKYGHPYSKRICLWLRGLPPLLPQLGYYEKHVQWHDHCSSSQYMRARFFEGIAEAMACQWGV